MFCLFMLTVYAYIYNVQFSTYSSVCGEDTCLNCIELELSLANINVLAYISFDTSQKCFGDLLIYPSFTQICIITYFFTLNLTVIIRLLRFIIQVEQHLLANEYQNIENMYEFYYFGFLISKLIFNSPYFSHTCLDMSLHCFSCE